MNGPLRLAPLTMVVLAGLAFGSPGPLSAAEAGDKAIHGTIALDESAGAAIASGDRLVIRLYRPSDGVEMDPRYRIVEAYELPLDFAMAPAIDMNGRTRWQEYVVEASTDRDGDVTSLTAGELVARTPIPVPLGTRGVLLELGPPL